jgi:hypothetical protein
MAVLAIKTEPKCKLCKHPNRAEIDVLLERRSNGDLDDKGRRFNADYVLEILGQWGVTNPTLLNIKGHWKNHCEVISSEEAEEVAAQLSELNTEMLAILDESDGSVDSDLRAIFRLGTKRLRGRILRGEDPGVTLDHQLKASSELTKRSHNESTRELLGTLAGGLVMAIEQQKQPKQIETAYEVIEQEAAES